MGESHEDAATRMALHVLAYNPARVVNIVGIHPLGVRRSCWLLRFCRLSVKAEFHTELTERTLQQMRVPAPSTRRGRRGCCVGGPAATVSSARSLPADSMVGVACQQSARNRFRNPRLTCQRVASQAFAPISSSWTADMRGGGFGEVMLTFIKGHGGAGIMADGCIRDFAS
jgi:hypothetical protein